MSNSTNDYRYLFGQEVQTECRSCTGAVWWISKWISEWHANRTHYSVHCCCLCSSAEWVCPDRWYKR